MRAIGMGIQRYTAIGKPDGELTQNAQEIMELWTGWINQSSQIPHGQETPEIHHITQGQWGEIQNTYEINYQENKPTRTIHTDYRNPTRPTTYQENVTSQQKITRNPSN